MPGGGDGTLGAPITLPNIQELIAVTAVDVNGDGRMDLIGQGQYGPWLAVYLNQTR